jgi:hypothetical protein
MLIPYRLCCPAFPHETGDRFSSLSQAFVFFIEILEGARLKQL